MSTVRKKKYYASSQNILHPGAEKPHISVNELKKNVQKVLKQIDKD